MTGKRAFFLIAAIVGAVLPYAFFVTHFWYDGFALGTFIRAVFVNPAAGGFAADLIVSSAVFWVFVFYEARARTIKHAWVFVLANLVVGLSFALPLFLFIREGKVEAQDQATAR